MTNLPHGMSDVDAWLDRFSPDELLDIVTSAAGVGEPRPPVESIAEIGALSEWRRQLRAGERKPTTFDALWRAAMYEERARDELRLDQVSAANESRMQAAELLLGELAA